MLRILLIIVFSVCLLGPIAPQVKAQYQDLNWLDVSPDGESFHLLMPNKPKVENEAVGTVSGQRYVALTGVATYTVWSLTNANYRSVMETDPYLDATAELFWEGLLRPARESVIDKNDRSEHITYVRELPPTGLPGREYSLSFGSVVGTAELFVAHEHIYILLAMGRPGEDWPRERFFASFRSSLSKGAPAIGDPIQNGGSAAPPVSASGEEDYNRVFTGKEVTKKVRVLDKPEPTYTESARKFGVEGTVVLRAVFAKDGQVTNVRIISKLPHGLTERAVTTARHIRFEPAAKDGHAVSMWIELQYNFNLF